MAEPRRPRGRAHRAGAPAAAAALLPCVAPLGAALLGTALLASALFARTAAAGELFRCGSWVVSAEMSVAELKQKCGEPTRRTRETQDVYAHAAGGGTIKTGTAVVERWIYQRGLASSMVVTITDGVITDMATSGQ